jgi:hypothetical protein
MAQHDFTTINPATYSGTDLSSDLNSWVPAVTSSHSGASRPSYASVGLVWYDTTGSQLKFFNGSTDDIILKGAITAFGISVTETADASALRTLSDVYSKAEVDALVTPSAIDKSIWPTLSQAADADHDILFSSGRVNDSGGDKILDLSSGLTKQLDAIFAEGDNLGGLFLGAIAADTAYACFVIEKDSDGSIDAGFDTDPDAANIPAGFTAYRRIGWVITDGSSNIIDFVQDGDYFYYKDQILDVNDSSPGTTENIVSMSMPPSVQGVFGIDLNDTGSRQVLVTSTPQTDSVPSSTNNTLRVNAGGQIQSVEAVRETNASGQIRYRSSNATVDALRIYSRGWIDQRVN